MIFKYQSGKKVKTERQSVIYCLIFLARFTSVCCAADVGQDQIRGLEDCQFSNQLIPEAGLCVPYHTDL